MKPISLFGKVLWVFSFLGENPGIYAPCVPCSLNGLYENFELVQGGGGLSPGKLRNMLLGVEKQRKEEQDIESTCTLRSQPFDTDEAG